MYLRRSSSTRRLANGTASILAAAFVSVVLLLGAGVAYRAAASAWDKKPGKQVELPFPLGQIPKQIDDWMGEDLEIPAVTQQYMRAHFADDYLSRRYFNAAERIWADAYIVYCSSRPSGILGHQPRVCYPNNGWIWDSTVESQFTSRSGRRIECLVHSFHRPAPAYQQICVLNFYVLNGRVTLRDKDFSSLFDRRPNLAGDPARYVAQVQISSLTEYSARTLASQAMDIILGYLPDQNGHVGVADTLMGPKLNEGAAETGK